MPRIHQLDPHVADLIAAGEVVERPASVVKELTENSIDAGASAVTVEIQRGGMSYIRVTDDGCGIEAEDCLTAFLRHATSKIRTEYDLEAIGTLGFRGEALAAVAAVSRVELMTRAAGAESGTAVLLDGGVVRRQEEAGCPRGTTLIVRDLFFNTPARQKFLKRDSAEGSAVFAVVQHAALSHPEVSFRFLREGKEELNTPGDGSLKSAVYAVLGRDVALGLVDCKGGGEDIAVEGFISQPVCCRGSRAGQFFFVNGRYVKSRTMQAALEQAYRNQKMVGKFPACVLHLTTRLSGVDVNVHPTKTEVKFASDKKLFDAVYYTVLAALDHHAGVPKADLEPKEKARPERHDTVTPNQTFFRTMSAGQFRGELRSDAKNPYVTAAPRRTPAEEPLGSGPAPEGGAGEEGRPFVPRQRPEQPLKRPPAAPLSREWTVTPTAPAQSPAETASAPLKSRDKGANSEIPQRKAPASEAEKPIVTPRSAPAEPTPATDHTPAEPAGTVPASEPVPAPAAETNSVPVPEEKAPERIPAPAEEAAPPMPEVPAAPVEDELAQEDTPDAPEWRLVGEVLRTYAVVERGDEVWFIDKHAAHERMNFDRLKAMGHRPMGQLLLQPLVLRLTPEEQETLLAHLPLLEEFGFEAGDFGGGSLIVRQAPDWLPAERIEPALEELAGRLLTTGTADPDAARDEVLHTMACKAAIKGGWKNAREELLAVCGAVMRGEVRYCPHGRPVAIRLTKKDLEKQFKRA